MRGRGVGRSAAAGRPSALARSERRWAGSGRAYLRNCAFSAHPRMRGGPRRSKRASQHPSCESRRRVDGERARRPRAARSPPTPPPPPAAGAALRHGVLAPILAAATTRSRRGADVAGARRARPHGARPRGARALPSTVVRWLGLLAARRGFVVRVRATGSCAGASHRRGLLGHARPRARAAGAASRARRVPHPPSRESRGRARAPTFPRARTTNRGWSGCERASTTTRSPAVRSGGEFPRRRAQIREDEGAARPAPAADSAAAAQQQQRRRPAQQDGCRPTRRRTCSTGLRLNRWLRDPHDRGGRDGLRPRMTAAARHPRRPRSTASHLCSGLKFWNITCTRSSIDRSSRIR